MEWPERKKEPRRRSCRPGLGSHQREIARMTSEVVGLMYADVQFFTCSLLSLPVPRFLVLPSPPRCFLPFSPRGARSPRTLRNTQARQKRSNEQHEVGKEEFFFVAVLLRRLKWKKGNGRIPAIPYPEKRPHSLRKAQNEIVKKVMKSGT